jgi:hypothetical protein
MGISPAGDSDYRIITATGKHRLAQTKTNVLTAHVPLPLADVDAGHVVEHRAVQLIVGVLWGLPVGTGGLCSYAQHSAAAKL